MQASCGAHLGVDNLNVVRHVGRLLDGGPSVRPFEIVKDGDLLCFIDRMLQLRGFDTVKVSKVKGHADEGMVLDGRVRDLDRLGNNAAEEAADFGRRRFLFMSLMLDVIWLGFVVGGILLFVIFIVFFCCYC